MGRAKASMELIKKEKTRNTTFRDRSNTLKKKVYELATLCDIKAVMIIYGPKQGTPQAHPLVPEIWPQNHDQVLELIDKYKGQSPEDCNTRTTLISDFFEERNKKAQQDLTTLRNNNLRSKYPTTLDQNFNGLKEEDCRKIVVSLENKIGNAKAKLEQMKANNIYGACHVQQQHMMLSKKSSMDFDARNQANKYLKNHPHQAISDPTPVPIPMPLRIHQQRFQFTDYNRNQVMVKFGNEYVGDASNTDYNPNQAMAKFGNKYIGGASNIVHTDFNWNQVMAKFGNEYVGGPSNIMHNAPQSEVVYDYPRIGGTLDSINYANNLVRAPQGQTAHCTTINGISSNDTGVYFSSNDCSFSSVL